MGAWINRQFRNSVKMAPRNTRQSEVQDDGEMCGTVVYMLGAQQMTKTFHGPDRADVGRQINRHMCRLADRGADVAEIHRHIY
jgi:hypothetical protein